MARSINHPAGATRSITERPPFFSIASTAITYQNLGNTGISAYASGQALAIWGSQCFCARSSGLREFINADPFFMDVMTQTAKMTRSKEDRSSCLTLDWVAHLMAEVPAQFAGVLHFFEARGRVDHPELVLSGGVLDAEKSFSPPGRYRRDWAPKEGDAIATRFVKWTTNAAPGERWSLARPFEPPHPR